MALDHGPNSVLINHYHATRVDEAPMHIGLAQLGRIRGMIQPWNREEPDDGKRISICHHYPLIEDERPARLRLALFFWEETRVPPDHIDHINDHFDAVLVATTFVGKALRDSGCILPIKVIPLGVDQIEKAHATAPQAEQKSKLFRFLHVSSAFPRKGVDVLLEAYLAEFSGTENVELYIKTFANIHNDLHEQIRLLTDGMPLPPNIHVDEAFLDEEALARLYLSSDAVVLPTRGEGFNLPAAEALALGRPVLSTAYSGQADFVTPHTGWCVDFSFHPSRSHLAVDGSLWLEPSCDDLRSLMRGFYDAYTQNGGQLAETVVDGRNVGATVARGAALVRSVYRWSNTGLVIRDFATRLLARKKVSDRALRVAWVSSWSSPTRLSEYSRMLVEELVGVFEIEHVCQTNTPKTTDVTPLLDQGPDACFDLAFDYIAVRGFDAIVVQYDPSLFDLHKAAPQLATLAEARPVILTLHTAASLVLDKNTNGMTVEHLRKLDRILVHTVKDLNDLKDVGLIENVVMMAQGLPVHRMRPDDREVDLHKITRPKMPDSQGILLATFGFAAPDKGVLELIEAVERLCHEGRAVRLLLLCAASDANAQAFARSVRQTIEIKGLSETIDLDTAFLPIETVFDRLQEVDLIVLPYQASQHSSSAAASLAIASGKPILTTPIAVFDELRDVALVTSDITPAALATSIVSFMDEPSQRQLHAVRQRNWIAARSWPGVADRFAKMIRGLHADHSMGKAPQGLNASLLALAPKEQRLPRPLCPAGIDYPRTGAPRPWLSRIYFLEGDARSIEPFAECGVPVPLTWRADRLWLETVDAGELRALHLAPSHRYGLDESVFVVSTHMLGLIEERLRPALMHYIRRHGMRTILLGDCGISLDRAAVLADVVLVADAEEQLRYDALFASEVQVSECRFAPPQVLAGREGAQSSLREIATVRSLCISGDNIHGSSLLAELQDLAACLKAGSRLASIRCEDDVFAAKSDSWTIIPFGEALQERVEETSSATALLMTACAPALIEEHEAGACRLMLNADLLVFENPCTYMSVFAHLSRMQLPISLLRHKAILLDKEDITVPRADRLAREMRRARPLRPSSYDKLIGRALPPFRRGAKQLSVCVSTYNRASWLRVTLPLIADDIAAYRGKVELIVVDNASTDATPQVVEQLSRVYDIIYIRNPENVGMLGNLAVAANAAGGDFVWILGDDDVVCQGTTRLILDAITEHEELELVYINYAYTHFSSPSDLTDVEALVAAATPISIGRPSRFHSEVRTFAANNENFFTAIYACVFRRDHAIAAYNQYTGDPPFSTMASCIPTTKYVLENMLDRPGFWIGSNQIVVNMNVSWIKYAGVWHIERLLEAYDVAEIMGVSTEAIMPYRVINVGQGIQYTESTFGSRDVRGLVSMSRYLERTKRMSELNARAGELMAAYEAATNGGPMPSTSLPSVALCNIYGLSR